MTEEIKQSDAGSRISDETLRQYLLGLLSEPERSEVDQSLLADHAFAERVEVAESQLIDAYVAGDLDRADRELFARAFLTSDERRQKLRLSSVLHGYAGAQTRRAVPDQTQASWFARLSNYFSLRPSLGWTAAGSFAVLLLLIGLAWFWSMRSSRPEPSIVKQEPPPVVSPRPDSTPAEIAQVSPPTESRPTPEPAPPISVATIVLVPGTLRGAGEMARVAVPRGERDVVRLTLTLENRAPGSYQVELSTAEGQTVAVRNNLKPLANQTRVTFDVPARLLQTGDYQVKLSRKADGQLEPVGRYYFRALPE